MIIQSQISYNYDVLMLFNDIQEQLFYLSFHIRDIISNIYNCSINGLLIIKVE